MVDPGWASFNYTSFTPDDSDAVIQGLNQIMTPPFGFGGRLVWLINSNICQHCPENVLVELQRTLPVIPENSLLLFTSSHRPDERLKSTKLLKKYAEFREFPLIPPWKTELLVQSVNQAAQVLGVKLTTSAVDMLVEAVGNDTRLLYNELEKLKLYAQGNRQALDANAVSQLVKNTTRNSLQLAAAIKTGNTATALGILADLLAACEPPLRIIATLTGQFRTWLWIKIMMESGERNQQAIAQAAEVANPNRIYYLQKEVNTLSVQQLVTSLPILLELEVSIKQGSPETTALQTKVIELCQVFQRN
jgi:DNA polymerase-3 subunit delta